MRWIGGRQSDNVEDRRGMSVSRGVIGGGIGTVILVVAALFFGIDPTDDSTTNTHRWATCSNDPAASEARGRSSC